MDRFWPALEYDFYHEHLPDPMSFLRGERSWLQFFRLKEELTQGTKYYAAKVSDPEIAAETWAMMTERERFAATRPPKEGGGPSFDGYTILIEHLCRIQDLLVKLLFTTSMSDSSKAQQLPRPKSEFQKLIDLAGEADARENVELKLFPTL